MPKITIKRYGRRKLYHEIYHQIYDIMDRNDINRMENRSTKMDNVCRFIVRKYYCMVSVTREKSTFLIKKRYKKYPLSARINLKAFL